VEPVLSRIIFFAMALQHPVGKGMDYYGKISPTRTRMKSDDA
jgi:hypothetical protein